VGKASRCASSAFDHSRHRGATDFSSQVAKMKSAGCELVVLGTIVRETVGTMAEARKTGFNPVFVGQSASYTDLIPKLGGSMSSPNCWVLRASASTPN
jgi:ABC-type branched-subunit amino acid transport system substrate-binding protein